MGNSRTPGETVPTQFRLKEDTLSDLDMIRKWLADTTGNSNTSRADAVRYAVREIARKLSRKKAKNILD